VKTHNGIEREAFIPKGYIHIIHAYGFMKVSDLLVLKQVMRKEIIDSSRNCFENIG